MDSTSVMKGITSSQDTVDIEKGEDMEPSV